MAVAVAAVFCVDPLQLRVVACVSFYHRALRKVADLVPLYARDGVFDPQNFDRKRPHSWVFLCLQQPNSCCQPQLDCRVDPCSNTHRSPPIRTEPATAPAVHWFQNIRACWRARRVAQQWHPCPRSLLASSSQQQELRKQYERQDRQLLRHCDGGHQEQRTAAIEGSVQK